MAPYCNSRIEGLLDFVPRCSELHELPAEHEAAHRDLHLLAWKRRLGQLEILDHAQRHCDFVFLRVQFRRELSLALCAQRFRRQIQRHCAAESRHIPIIQDLLQGILVRLEAHHLLFYPLHLLQTCVTLRRLLRVSIA